MNFHELQFLLREKVEKNITDRFTMETTRLTILHGILGSCRSQLKSKLHSLISLPCKFDIHIYHSIQEK